MRLRITRGATGHEEFFARESRLIDPPFALVFPHQMEPGVFEAPGAFSSDS